MKNQVKKFGQFLNESRGHKSRETEITLSVSYGTADEVASSWTEIARLAPNCEVVDIRGVKGDYFDITLVGSEEECTAVADYWNKDGLSDDIHPSPHGMVSTWGKAVDLLNRRQERERPMFKA